MAQLRITFESGFSTIREFSLELEYIDMVDEILNEFDGDVVSIRNNRTNYLLWER